jgi:hypothetical protein
VAVAADTSHMSQINLKNEDVAYETVLGDADGETAVIGRVGAPFRAQVAYKVGWSTFPREGGSEQSHRSDISNPEYEGFGALPPGVSMSRSEGILQGTPSAAGRWDFWPAVRDKDKGQSPFRGQGFWWTTYREYEGKTWIQAKDKTVLVVMPAATGKEFRLLCVFPKFRTILEIDYDNKLVKLIGDNGKVAGVYNVTVDADVVGWNKMSASNLYVASALLDRKTAQLVVKYQADGSTATGNCEKRSETQKF